jgi:serine/threonine-protein kinase MRCK
VPPTANPAFSGHHLPFIGFTFTQDSCLSDVGKLTKKDDQAKQQQQPLQLISTKTTTTTNTNSIGNNEEKRLSPDSTRKLQDEINILTKRNCELENQLKSIEQRSTTTTMAASSNGTDLLDGHPMDVKVKELEKAIAQLKQEKDDMAKEKNDALDRLKLQDKECKDALAQRKLAMTEYTEVTDKLSELRTQKQKLSRQVRDKEEEVETAMQKIDTIRNDLRKAEKSRRELESRLQEAMTECTKERQQRERSEEYCRQMQLETRSRTSDLGSSQSSLGLSSDSIRLEIERLEIEYTEKLNQQQSRFNVELVSLREQLNDVETHRNLLEIEVGIVRVF